jgi:pilus assembly protein FimV
MVAALGLGELTLNSYLNEPLNAEVQLLEIGDLDPSQIRVRLATREDFSRAGVERAYFLTSLKFEVVSMGMEGAKLEIRSSDPVREPYLNFIVEARWPTGRLLREYTVLLDPPVFVGDESGVIARASAPRREPAPQQQPSYSEPAPAEPEPGAMPRRNYGADAMDAPAVGEKYMVERGDTLWEIATAATPSGASIQQTMLDILRLNPEAFINDNINQLKAGYVLRLPTSSEITRTFEEAVAEVERQTQRWQSGESAMDTRLDASEGLDVSGVAGSDSGDGHLQIAGVESADESYTGGEVSARMEDLDRARRENADLSTRLGSMEEQLEMQERLISLKDEQIAALQDALDQADAEAPVVDIQEGTIETLDPLDAVQPEPVPVAEDPQQPAPAEPEVEPAPKPAPPPPPEPTIVDLIMENIMYVGIGVLVLILLVVLLLRRRGNRAGDDGLPFTTTIGDEDDFADVSLSEDSLVVDEFDEGEEEHPEQRPEPVSAFGAADEDAYAAQFEAGDALAEADIYIAYGRFPQAVDLLKAAIAVEPANTDYRIKLMEACVEMVESGEFQQQYADLEVIGDDNVLQRARALLQAVDGGDAWLEGLPEPSITAEDVEEAQRSATAARAPGPEADHEVDELGELELDTDIEPAGELDLDTDIEPAGELDLDEAAMGELEEDTGGLELDLEEDVEGFGDVEVGSDDLEESLEYDLGDDFDNAPADEPEEEDEISLEPSPMDESDELDLEELDLPDEEYEGSEAEPAAEAGEPEGAAAGEEFATGFKDLDLGLTGETSVSPEEVALEEEPEAELSDLVADLAGESADEVAESPATAAEDDSDILEAVADELVNGSELDGAELDLSGDDSDEDLASMELDMSADAGEDDEGLVFAADGDEIATKLDLARAYIDMGDDEGARSILQEVMEGGNETQQQEANSLLEGIG